MKTLWTDGSASPNPGPGGWAVLEIVNNEANPVALGREKHTTNIRMEAQALIAAIKYAAQESCEIHTDSEFWINVITKWAPGWEANGWRKKTGEIKNLDLVQELHALYQSHDVTLIWEKGHAGTKFNELADSWANEARLGKEL
ncbi:ribonuclease HI [Candidatus Saccharibacteria bacterium]|nr:ribonuclease HI [Candidatus Saccharibacteria bacterium]